MILVTVDEFRGGGRLEPGGAGVVEWRDADGRLSAYALREGERAWIRVPGVGLFGLSGRSERVEVRPDPEAPPGSVDEHYFRAILPLALQLRGHEVLHASAVRTPSGVLALAAPKESGKSTLAYALGELGHPPWADDAVVFSSAERGVEALSVPFDLRLRSDPARLFGRERLLHVTRRGRSGAEPIHLAAAPFAAVVVLERRPPGEAAPIELDRLAPAAALAALLQHAFCFDLEEMPRKARMVRQYLDLVARVPVLRLRYPTGLEHVPAVAARLAAVVRAEARVPA